MNRKIVLIFFVFMSVNVLIQLNAVDLKLNGSWGYNVDYSKHTVHITGDKIINNSSDGISGSIKLYLYLTKTQYTGGSITGFTLYECKFDPLLGGYQYDNLNNELTYYNRPPTGLFYVTLILTENIDGEYCIVDYINFDKQISYVNQLENNSYITQPNLPQVEKDNSVMIMFWKNELARETRNLVNAENDYRWAQENASNNLTGSMLKQTRLRAVQSCSDRVDNCKRNLRALGCYDY